MAAIAVAPLGKQEDVGGGCVGLYEDQITISCRRTRRLAVGTVEMGELVPGNGRREQTKEICESEYS